MSDKVTYTQIQNYLKENPGDLERLVLEAIPETKGAVSLAGHKPVSYTHLRAHET